MKKEMLINVLQPEECRIAIVEDGQLEELYVERTSHESFTGNIYKGRVVNLEPAIQAAFVDFSVGRNGFLHVSDVEPQYYRRQASGEDLPSKDPRRRRPETERPARDRDVDRPRPPRPEARDPLPPPGHVDERPRDRDRDRDRYADRERDRPDRSEKGRKDRSERRFGEGLFEDFGPPPTSHRHVEPISRQEPDRAEPRRRSDAPPAPVEEPRHVAAPPPAARQLDPIVPAVEDRDEPRGRIARPIDPIEADLPPSRTSRPRPAPSFADPYESDDSVRARTAPAPAPPPPPIRDVEYDRGRERDAEPAREIDSESTRTDAARGRGRGRDRDRDRDRGRDRDRERPRRLAAEPESRFAPPAPTVPPPSVGYDAEADIEPADILPEVDSVPGLDVQDEFSSEASPRRRGRDAIRSRGGDRERQREPRADREPPRPRPSIDAPAARVDRTRDFELEREPEVEARRFRPPEPERVAEREDRDRGARRRSAEPERPARERSAEPPARPVDRAGEEGYVPRRQRASRPGDAPVDAEPVARRVPPAPASWNEVEEPADDRELDAIDDLPGEDVGDDGLKGGRRRRRRRGRRRDRPERGPSLEASSSEPADVDDIELDDVPDIEEDRSGPVGGPAPRSREVRDDFDFEDEDAEDDLDDEEIERVKRPVEADDRIDPELEEEIRRESEEIAELERELGLRGVMEARPRPGDDVDLDGGRGGKFSRGRGMVKPPIQEVFRRGDEVLVQVIKESLGTKGPTLSTYISIPGRYLVLMPGLNRVGVSRKIADDSQRRKLRQTMNQLNPPKGLGFIVRTAGLDRTKHELARDLAYLLRLWKVILRRLKKAKGPTPIYQESDMIIRTIRDIFTAEIDTIWIDEPQAFEHAQEFLRVVMPRYVNRLKLYEEKVPLFHKYGIEDEIAKIQRRRVDLPDGGSIVIDQTEALVAIDVNSGNFRVENDAERTAYEMNLRAAKEIARQLRLRDLGGVIVNDFIDMREEKNRRGVERALREAIRRDRARTKVLRMSAFGIIEMTRQRIRPSLKRSVYEDCRHCGGAGVVKTVESMAIDVMRLLALAGHREDVRRVNVSVSSAVATHLNNRKRVEIVRIEQDSNMIINIRHDEHDAPPEHLQVDCFDAAGNEIRLNPNPPALPQPQRRGRVPRD